MLTKKVFTKKKVYKKRAAKKTPINRSMVNLGKGFPKKITFTHTYMDNDSLASTVGVFAKLNYSCNSMYDPNRTFAGHQPMYFDQLSALYDHYCVVSSHITVKVLPGTAALNAFACGVFVNDDSITTPSTFTGANENSLSNYKYVPAGATTAFTLKKSWNAAKYFGKNPLANTELQGTQSTSPTEESFFTVYIQSLDLISTTSAFIETTIVYTAVWKELKDIAGS